MLTCITNVRVVFSFSPGSISVFFSNVFKRGLHLFVYSFKLVIQVHYIASIHLRGCHQCKKWKTGLCPTCWVLKCLCSIKCKFEGWIPCLLTSGHMEAAVCTDVATPLANVIQLEPHPSIQMLRNWKTIVIRYGTNQLKQRNYELNSINKLNDTLQSRFPWFSTGKLALLTFVCYPEAPKNKRSSRTWLTHPSSSAPLIEAEIFWKNRNYISPLPGSFE